MASKSIYAAPRSEEMRRASMAHLKLAHPDWQKQFEDMDLEPADVVSAARGWDTDLVTAALRLSYGEVAPVL